MGYVLAGMLQGLGKGLSMEAEQRRENALLALRRQYQLEDAASAEQRTIATEQRAETRDIAKDERDAKVKTGLLDLAHRFKRQENETDKQWEERLIRIRGEEDRKTATHKGGIDRNLEAFKSKLDIKEDAASKRLAAEIDGGQVKSVEAAEDGTMLVTYTNGNVVRKNVKLRETRRAAPDDEGGEGTIAAARARQNGGDTPAKPAAKPKADDNAAARAQALARLGNVYHRATPGEFPGLFKNGKKIPIEEAKALIRQRYP